MAKRPKHWKEQQQQSVAQHATDQVAANVVQTAFGNACTRAVIQAEERYEAQRLYRQSDRIDGLLMRHLSESPSRRRMCAKERHRLTALIDGELSLNEEWRLP
jgi:hypothetical protein